jgi:hypothetical protein
MRGGELAKGFSPQAVDILRERDQFRGVDPFSQRPLAMILNPLANIVEKRADLVQPRNIRAKCVCSDIGMIPRGC